MKITTELSNPSPGAASPHFLRFTPPPPPPPPPPAFHRASGRNLARLPKLHANMNEACRVVGEVVEVLREKVDGENFARVGHDSPSTTTAISSIEMTAATTTTTAVTNGSCEIVQGHSPSIASVCPSSTSILSVSSTTSASNPVNTIPFSSPVSKSSSIPQPTSQMPSYQSSPPPPPLPPPLLPPPSPSSPSSPPPSSPPLSLPPSSALPSPHLAALDIPAQIPAPKVSAPPLPPKCARLPPPTPNTWPPPPPPSVLKIADTSSTTKSETCQNVQIRRFAESFSDEPEWRRGHFLFHFRKTESVLQIGPTCGLVALRMLCGVTSTPPPAAPLPPSPPPSIETLLSHAQTHGFSSQGEMFSCVKMNELVRAFLPGSESRVVRQPDQTSLMRHLLRGGLALVPYDKDRNFGPTTREGHKAHWAVILGCVVSLPQELLKRLASESRATIDLQFEASKTSMLHALECPGPLFILDDGDFSTMPSTEGALNDAAVGAIGMLRRPSLYRTTKSGALLMEAAEGDSKECLIDEVLEKMLRFRLVALQGKSRKLLFWEVDELLRSNRQLTSYDLTAVEGTLLFPDGNVERGLCDQIVLVDLP